MRNMSEGSTFSKYVVSIWAFPLRGAGALFELIFGTVKKQMKEIGSKKSAPRCPFDRGWGTAI